jgi:ABC-type Fe3+-citrate transport system substrate-binding protein
MIRQILGLTVLLLFVSGCASTLENANTGAEKVGEAGGKVMRIPHSVSEGTASGIAGEPDSNPYNR